MRERDPSIHATRDPQAWTPMPDLGQIAQCLLRLGAATLTLGREGDGCADDEAAGNSTYM
jgi:hypothetical protein